MKNTLIYIFIFASLGVIAQKRNPIRLQNFDDRRYHYGFVLAYTNSNFLIDEKANYSFSDSLVSINSIKQSAFAVGPTASLNLTRNWRVRTGLYLSFQDRMLHYQFVVDDSLTLFPKEVPSVYLEVPLHFKLRTDRINNFAVYTVFGGKYGRDMTSRKDIQVNMDFEDIVKIKRTNIAYEVGGGMDFFFEYFKFGIELKLAIGLNNVLINNGTFFANPIEKLRTQMWQLSFTFEG